jgi:hypothetical protein
MQRSTSTNYINKQNGENHKTQKSKAADRQISRSGDRFLANISPKKQGVPIKK